MEGHYLILSVNEKPNYTLTLNPPLTNLSQTSQIPLIHFPLLRYRLPPIHLVCERIPYPPSLDPKFVSHNTDTLSSSISNLGLDLSDFIHHNKQRVVLPQSQKTKLTSSNHETLTKLEGHHP